MLTGLWDLQRAGDPREGKGGVRLSELTQLGLGIGLALREKGGVQSGYSLRKKYSCWWL